MTGAIITAIGGLLTVVIGTLLGWFIRRTDRVAKMTQANIVDQQYVMRLVSVLRDDYWTLADSWYALRGVARALAIRVGGAIEGELIPDRIPTPLHREIEKRHAEGLPLDDEEK